VEERLPVCLVHVQRQISVLDVQEDIQSAQVQKSSPDQASVFLDVEHADLDAARAPAQAQPLLHASASRRAWRSAVESRVARHQVAEATRLGDALEHLLDHVSGRPDFVAQLRPVRAPRDTGHERGIIRLDGRLISASATTASR